MYVHVLTQTAAGTILHVLEGIGCFNLRQRRVRLGGGGVGVFTGKGCEAIK
jgi:hypothetical protein